MPATALQRMNSMVSLIDRVSGSAGEVMKKMDQVTAGIQAGSRKIEFGVNGLINVGHSLVKFVAPAMEMRTALEMIGSLGVEQSALANLRKTAQRTAVEYGGNAIEIVNASYLLQSAISDIEGNQLSMLVNKSTLLAKATKGSLESTNAFVGQMFNIHAVEANAIGKTAFMDKLIAKTAKSVQLFNTDGQKMSEAMKNIGKQATAMKVPLGEQLAVMGFLQNTMIEGSRSGTAYLSFLSNINKAETTLGMSFTDKEGAVLPMVEIISKLEGKFGDLNNAADQELLQKAFGKRGQAVLLAMAGSMDTFQGHLDQINKTTGLEDIIRMARDMTAPWDQASAGVTNFRIEFGDKLLTYLNPVYEKIVSLSQLMVRWMYLFPNLTGWIAKATLAILGVIAAVSALSIVIGIKMLLMSGWTLAVSAVGWAFGSLLMPIVKATWGVLGFTAALLANPITWVVVAIIGLIAAIAAAFIYWDQWTAVVVEFSSRFLESIGVFSFVDEVVAIWDKLPQWWQSFKSFLSKLNPFKFISKSIDWLIDKINLIPGINIGGAGLNPVTDKNTPPVMPKSIPAPAALALRFRSGAGAGVIQQITNAATANNSRSIGDVTVINQGQAMSGQDFVDELMFASA